MTKNAVSASFVGSLVAVLVVSCPVVAQQKVPGNGAGEQHPSGQQAKNPRGSSVGAAVPEVHRIDFRNFIYVALPSDRKDYHLPESIQVKDGEFKAGKEMDEVYFGITGIEYGDLTGDGREEAVVHATCGMSMGNGGTDDFYMYVMNKGHVESLGTLSSDEMTRDYLRHQPDGILWRVSSVKVKDGKLDIEWFADGSHAAPQFIVTLEYRWNGHAFVMNGAPQKRKFGK